MNENLETTQTLIVRDFELEPTEKLLPEEELLRLLSEQIAYLIDHKVEVLFSLMYRLDVDENRVNAALAPFAPEPANVGLAKLVLERQKQRVYTKQYYKPEKPWNWEE